MKAPIILPYEVNHKLNISLKPYLGNSSKKEKNLPPKAMNIFSSKSSKISNTTPIGKIRSIVISDDTQAKFTVKSGSSQDACNTSVSAESDNRTFNFTGDASYFTIEVSNTTIAHVTKITVTYE